VNEHEDRLAAVLQSLTDEHAPTDLRERLLDRHFGARTATNGHQRRWAVVGVAAATVAVIVAAGFMNTTTRSDDHTARPAVTTTPPTADPGDVTPVCQTVLGKEVSVVPRLEPDLSVTAAVVCGPNEYHYEAGTGVWDYGVEYDVPTTDLAALVAVLRSPDAAVAPPAQCPLFLDSGLRVVLTTGSGAPHAVRLPHSACGDPTDDAQLTPFAIPANQREVRLEQLQSQQEVDTGCSPMGEDAMFPWRIARNQRVLPDLPAGQVAVCTYRHIDGSEVDGVAVGTAPAAELADLWKTFSPGATASCVGAPQEWFSVISPGGALPVKRPVTRQDWANPVHAIVETDGCGRVFDDTFRQIGTVDPTTAEQAAALATTPTVTSARLPESVSSTETPPASSTEPMPLESGEPGQGTAPEGTADPLPLESGEPGEGPASASAPAGTADPEEPGSVRTLPYPSPGNPVTMEVPAGAFRTFSDGTDVLCLPGQPAIVDLGFGPIDPVCGRFVTLVGLDPDGPQEPADRSTGKNYPTARFVGSFDGTTFTVQGQFRPLYGTTPAMFTYHHYPCRPPTGEWKATPETNTRDFNTTLRILVQRSEVFGNAAITRLDNTGTTVSGPSDGEDVILIGYVGEESAARAILEDAPITNLCLVPIEYSQFQTLKQRAFLGQPSIAGGLEDQLWTAGPRPGPFSASGLPGSLQPTTVVEVDYLTAEIAAVIEEANTMGPPVTVIAHITQAH